MLACLLLLAAATSATPSLCERFCYTPISEGIFCTHICASHVFKQHVAAQKQLQETILLTRMELQNARLTRAIGAAAVDACDSTALESCIESLDFTTMLLKDIQSKTMETTRVHEEFSNAVDQVIRTYGYIVTASLAMVVPMLVMILYQD